MHEDTFTDLTGFDPISVASLKRINIDLSSCETITTEGLKGLFRYIGTYHKELTSFQLKFYYCSELTDDAIKELSLQIETNLKHLKRIDFSFKGCKHMSDEAITELIQKVGMRSKTLKSLNLDLSECIKCSETVLRELGNQIQRLEHLVSLKLSTNFLGDDVSTYFFERLGRLENLRILSLNIRDLQNLRITDNAVMGLATCIENLPRLQILSLYFDETIRITDNSAQCLVNKIGSSLHHLMNFSIGFRGCEKIGDETVKALRQQISPDILCCDYLNICFKRCFRVTSREIKNLVRAIAIGGHLYQSLGLNFAQCGNLDDRTCIEIAEIASEGPITLHLVLNLSQLNLEAKTKRCIKKLLEVIPHLRIHSEL